MALLYCVALCKYKYIYPYLHYKVHLYSLHRTSSYKWNRYKLKLLKEVDVIQVMIKQYYTTRQNKTLFDYSTTTKRRKEQQAYQHCVSLFD